MHALSRRTRSRVLVAGAATLALGFLALVAFAATPPRRPARSTPLTDANIVAIVEVANQGDIDNGSLAVQRGADAAVKDFGKMMVRDHGSANAKTKALAARLRMRPVNNATSRGLVKSAGAKHAELSQLEGPAFDRAYMDAEVTLHQAVLDMLDQKLIPAARNAELKALLNGIRPVVASHLDKAKEVRGNLKG